MKKGIRVIAIGLDGATWDLIRPWAHEKKLPTFRQLIQEGAWGQLESTVPPLSPSAWNSVFTGVKPTKHGIFSFVKRKRDSYFIRPIGVRDIKATTMWQLLSERNIRSVFLNVPFAYPPVNFNGLMTTGLGTPSNHSAYTYPPNLKNKILRLFPDYRIDFNEDKILRARDLSFVVDEVLTVTNTHINAFKYLYAQEKKISKVFFIVLRSLDVIQHYFWDDRELILKVYQQADEFINWCIENKEKKDILLVCSDHGFRRVDKRIYINQWLETEGFLKRSTSRISHKRRLLPSAELLHNLLIALGLRKLIWRIKHSKHLEKLMRLFPSSQLLNPSIVKWDETDAYYLEGSAGILQINLHGREAKGKISTKLFNETREQVIKNLSILTDPETDRKVFKFVKKGEEIYGCSGECPDIVAYPCEGYTIQGGFSKSSQIFENETRRNGDHDVKGVFCVYGEPIRNKVLRDVKVWDVAAVVLTGIGLDIPNNFDGRVPSGLFRYDLPKRRFTISSTTREKARIRKVIRRLNVL